MTSSVLSTEEIFLFVDQLLWTPSGDDGVQHPEPDVRLFDINKYSTKRDIPEPLFGITAHGLGVRQQGLALFTLPSSN